MNLDNLTKRFSSSTENQRKAIFSTLFIAGNKLQTLFDNHIPEVSLKQFMLLSIIRQSKEQLTFTQLGNLLGCSRQNIKKLADVLMKKGFITIQQSPHDTINVISSTFLLFFICNPLFQIFYSGI